MLQLDSTPPTTNHVSAIIHEVQRSVPCVETPVTAESLHSLNCLPDDILHAIFTYLPIDDILAILEVLPENRPFVEHAVATRHIELDKIPFNQTNLQLLQTSAADVALGLFDTEENKKASYTEEISSFRRLLSLKLYVYHISNSFELNINWQLEKLHLDFENYYSIGNSTCPDALSAVDSYISQYPGLRYYEVINCDLPSDRLLKLFPKLDQLTFFVLKNRNSKSLISSVIHAIASFHRLRHITINFFGNSLCEWLQSINGENFEKVELFLYEFEKSDPLEWHRLQNVHTLNISFVSECDLFAEKCCVGWSKLVQLRHLSVIGEHCLIPKDFLTGYNALQELKLDLQLCMADEELPKLTNEMPALRILDLNISTMGYATCDEFNDYEENMNDLIRELCALNRLETLSITSQYSVCLTKDVMKCFASFTTLRKLQLQMLFDYESMKDLLDVTKNMKLYEFADMKCDNDVWNKSHELRSDYPHVNLKFKENRSGSSDCLQRWDYIEDDDDDDFLFDMIEGSEGDYVDYDDFDDYYDDSDES